MAKLEADPLLVQIPISRLPVYECMAILFSYLTFSSQNESAQRAKVQIAICRQFLAEKSRREPDWQRSFQKENPSTYSFLKTSKKAFKEIYTIYGDRIGAALTAEQYIMDNIQRIFSQKEFEVKNSLSISRMSEILAPNLSQKDPGNVHSRIWKPSILVIYLDFVISTCLQDLVQGEQTILYSLTSNETFLRTVI